MKSINKLFGTFAAVCLLLGGAACTDEVEYTGAELQNANQPYFPTNLASQIDLAEDATSFTVQVSRLATGSELTVNLEKSDDENGLFSVPPTATFAADATTADITISYDPANFELDEYMPLTITIASEGVENPYGSNTYSLEAGIPAPYVTIGEATFTDNGYFGGTVEVELQQHSLDANQYRLVAPYATLLRSLGEQSSAAQSPYVTFRLLQPGDQIGNITATQPDLVYFEPSNTGYTNPTYGQDIMIYHPGYFQGSFPSESYWLYNKVISYKEDGTPAIVQLAPMYYMDGTGGWDYTQQDGVITIVFPDVVITDYSVSMSYEGSYTDPTGANYVLTNVNLGADVFEARLALVSANDDPNAVVAGILDGSIETTAVRESGEVQFLSNGNGTYYLVGVTYSRDESGAETAQEANYIDFIHSAGEIAPIDAYVGQWVVQGLINAEGAQPQNFLLTIANDGDGLLAVSGAFPQEGYDDTFYLQYDPISGYVILPPQNVASLAPQDETAATLVVPFDMEGGSFTTAETITGKLDEYGGLSFYNTYGNEGNWTSFAYVLSTAQGASLASYYLTYFMPYAAAANTRSLVGTTTNALPSLKPGMTLKKVEKQVKPAEAVDIVIKHLNGDQSIKNHGAPTPAQLN